MWPSRKRIPDYIGDTGHWRIFHRHSPGVAGAKSVLADCLVHRTFSFMTKIPNFAVFAIHSRHDETLPTIRCRLDAELQILERSFAISNSLIASGCHGNG